MNIGKAWQWPTAEELVEWEAKIKHSHSRAISPGNQLMLIKAVRSQRKCIEKLVKLLAQNGNTSAAVGPQDGEVTK